MEAELKGSDYIMRGDHLGESGKEHQGSSCKLHVSNVEFGPQQFLGPGSLGVSGTRMREHKKEGVKGIPQIDSDLSQEIREDFSPLGGLKGLGRVARLYFPKLENSSAGIVLRLRTSGV